MSRQIEEMKAELMAKELELAKVLWERDKFAKDYRSIVDILADIMVGGNIGSFSIENGELVQPKRDARMKAEALEEMRDADLLLHVVDASSPLSFSSYYSSPH